MPENPHILIAYFSHTGNTENAAQIIQGKTGADIKEIEMETPYRGNIYEVSQADMNQNIHPALRTHIENMDAYDVILLGYPTWLAYHNLIHTEWIFSPKEMQKFHVQEKLVKKGSAWKKVQWMTL